MKVLQLIDSLSAGGAEHVAVNYANSLVNKTQTSYLCATRTEGELKKKLSENVHYLFLNKRSTLDFKSIKKLSFFIKANKIDIIHAHTSSYFIATIIKILNPKIVLIWHEHFGNRDEASILSKSVLKICSYFFSCVIAVNKSLKIRSERALFVKNVFFLPNYAIMDSSIKSTLLFGELGKRIVCIANLRADKDHLNLLKAFKSIKDKCFTWTLHIVGKDFNDDYSLSIKTFIKENNLENHVFIYGSCPDVSNILAQSNIGVLSSKSEGLPIALLEYGLSKLPVIVTRVGDCDQVVSHLKEGVLVLPENPDLLADALITLINNSDLREVLGNNLYLKVQSSFSESNSLDALINIYKFCIK